MYVLLGAQLPFAANVTFCHFFYYLACAKQNVCSDTVTVCPQKGSPLLFYTHLIFASLLFPLSQPARLSDAL